MPQSTRSQDSGEHLLTQDYAYVELGEKSTLQAKESFTTNSARFTKNSRRILATIGLLLSLTILALITFSPRRSHSSNIYTNRCGNSSEEAKAAGCVFDLINYAWQPPACFDEEVYNNRMEHAMKKGPYKFYLDENGTQEIAQDIEVLSRTPIVYAEHRYHMEHCLYTWELLHHAVKKGTPIVEFFSEYTHTQHCIGYLSNPEPDWKIVNTHVKIWFNPCVQP